MTFSIVGFKDEFVSRVFVVVVMNLLNVVCQRNFNSYKPS